jgi:lysophosphatidate acyltransferase
VYLEQELSRLKVTPIFKSHVFEKRSFDVYVFTVLPPISTTGLTTDEVSALATRVRDQMLTTLRGISINVPWRGVEKSLVTDSADDAAIADRSTPSPSIPSEMPTEATVPPSPTDIEAPSTDGSQILKDGSENGTETEEDDGMVLVGHPK